MRKRPEPVTEDPLHDLDGGLVGSSCGIPVLAVCIPSAGHGLDRVAFVAEFAEVRYLGRFRILTCHRALFVQDDVGDAPDLLISKFVRWKFTHALPHLISAEQPKVLLPLQ